MRFNVLAALSLAAVVLGQSSTSTAPPAPSSTPVIPACVLTCSTTAAASAGCVLTDLTCVCTNVAFQTAAGTCITTTCSPEDQAAALAIQAQQCAAVPTGASSGTPTGTASGTGSASLASSAVSSAASRASSAPAASSAAAGTVGVDGALAVLGALVGGVLAL